MDIELFKLNFDDFLDLSRRKGINAESSIRLIHMMKGEHHIYILPDVEARYCTIIHKEDLSQINELNFLQISYNGEIITMNNLALTPVQNTKVSSNPFKLEEEKIKRQIENLKKGGFYN